MAMSNTLPKTIGQYEVTGLIGRGGMGMVYKAIDPRLEREVAIKVIKLPDDPSITPATRRELIERFKREAKASAKLNHPNIVSVYDFGEENGDNYMVMELMHGRDLDELLKIKAPLSMDVALRSLVQVCSALDFAHRRGIIHRDIKPGNIVIMDNGVSKLADFGIARVEAAQSNLTQAGSILGSLMYISPEQLMSAGSVDKRADIYSLGVTAYEVLTGQLPYAGENIAQIITKLMNSEPQLPSQVNTDLPNELDFVLFKAMSKTPDSRYSTAGEFGDALQEILTKYCGADSNITIPVPSTGSVSTTPTIDSSSPTQIGGELPPISTSSPSVMGSNMSMAATMMGQGKSSGAYKLVAGIDDNSLFSIVHRVVQDWNIENLSTNTMLEAIYLHEGKSQALIINDKILILIYQGMIIGSVTRQPELLGSEAYAQMASWQKFNMKQCLPLEKDEVWLILLATILGSNNVKLHNPMCDKTELNHIISEQKSSKFTGMIKVLEKQTCTYTAYLDGEQVFSIESPFPEGQQETEFIDIQVLLPRIILHGPSLRDLLSETSSQLVKKSVNIDSLSQFANKPIAKIRPEELESALRNTKIHSNISKDEVYKIGNRKINHTTIFEQTDHYQFINWLIFTNLYAVTHHPEFKKIFKWFKWITEIKSLKFLQPMKAPGGFSATFDVIGYDSDDKLALLSRMKYQLVKEDLNKIINDVKTIREDKGDVVKAAFLMTRKEIPEEVKQEFAKVTAKPFPTAFGDFFNPMQGFVRLGFYKGFYLFILSLVDDDCIIHSPDFN